MTSIILTLNATVFSLSIALTVFVLLTVVLIALLISLGASKNFRALFFHENAKKQRTRNAAKQAESKGAKSEPAKVSPKAIDEPQASPAEPAKPVRRERKAKPAQPEYLDAVPTVPLNSAFIEKSEPKQKRAQSTYIPHTVPLPRTGSRDAASAERTVTIEPAKPAVRRTVPVTGTRTHDEPSPKTKK